LGQHFVKLSKTIINIENVEPGSGGQIGEASASRPRPITH